MGPERIIRTCGRLTLCQSEQGFWWSLTSRRDQQWYWNPASRHFTAVCHFSRTESAASAGLEWTLTLEKAGDLDQQTTARDTKQMASGWRQPTG
jgi:hypothetical protein